MPRPRRPQNPLQPQPLVPRSPGRRLGPRSRPSSRSPGVGRLSEGGHAYDIEDQYSFDPEKIEAIIAISGSPAEHVFAPAPRVLLDGCGAEEEEEGRGGCEAGAIEDAELAQRAAEAEADSTSWLRRGPLTYSCGTGDDASGGGAASCAGTGDGSGTGGSYGVGEDGDRASASGRNADGGDGDRNGDGSKAGGGGAAAAAVSAALAEEGGASRGDSFCGDWLCRSRRRSAPVPAPQQEPQLEPLLCLGAVGTPQPWQLEGLRLLAAENRELRGRNDNLQREVRKLIHSKLQSPSAEEEAA